MVDQNILRTAALALESVAESSLDYRPEFRHALADLHVALHRAAVPAVPASALTDDQIMDMAEPFHDVGGVKFDEVAFARFLLATPSAAPADPEQAKLDSLAQAGLAAALESRAKGDAGTVAWKSLSDAQWVTIVNSCHGYVNMSTEDAVHTAVKMTEEKLRELNAIQPKAAPEATSEPDEPTDREQLIACLGDDAATLIAQNPDDEMAQTMLDAAAMLEATSEQMGGAQAATLSCPQCGVDRLKEPCPGTGDDCAMVADAHLLATTESTAEGEATSEQMGGVQVARAEWRDKLRWSKANTDYHGYVAFTPGQLEHFVSMLIGNWEPKRAAEEQATERKPLTIVEAKAEAAAPEAPDDAQGTPYFRDVEFDPPSGLFTTITSLGHGIGSDK